MVVCAHGSVEGFCEAHDMKILERYDGDLNSYRGSCAVIVTGQVMSREEYDSLKCSLFSRGVELVSVDWTDDDVILRLLRHQLERRGKHGGRQMFGFIKTKGVIVGVPEKIAIARRIVAMRDAGAKLREIGEEFGLSMSTIRTILDNRDKYV